MTREFHYRLGRRVGGYRPGFHAGLSVGTGQDFTAHARLYDNPDPRRLDLRASIRNPRGDWLVRTYQQRAALTLHAVVDVTPSMRFGTHRTKLMTAIDFVESMGQSAFGVGDAAGLITFDSQSRDDLYVPARYSRGVGVHMGGLLRQLLVTPGRGLRQKADHDYAHALAHAVQPLAGKTGLVFLVSDFHWPLTALKAVFDLLIHATVIPIVIWDPAEMEPPARNGLLALRDAESGSYRPVWVTDSFRNQWRAGVSQRRREINSTFEKHGIKPLHLHKDFSADAVSKYFLEQVV